MTETESFVGIVKTYYDEEQTEIEKEYFINAGKKEGV